MTPQTEEARAIRARRIQNGIAARKRLARRQSLAGPRGPDYGSRLFRLLAGCPLMREEVLAAADDVCAGRPLARRAKGIRFRWRDVRLIVRDGWIGRYVLIDRGRRFPPRALVMRYQDTTGIIFRRYD